MVLNSSSENLNLCFAFSSDEVALTFSNFSLSVHQNYVGTDHEKNPFFLSVVLNEDNNTCVPLYRAILFKKTVSSHPRFNPHFKPLSGGAENLVTHDPK